MSRTESTWTEEKARALTGDEIDGMAQRDLRQAVRASGYVSDVPSLTVQGWTTDQLRAVLTTGTLPMYLEQPKAEDESAVAVQDEDVPSANKDTEAKKAQLHSLIEDIVDAGNKAIPEVDLTPLWDSINTTVESINGVSDEVGGIDRGLTDARLGITELRELIEAAAGDMKGITDALASTGTGVAARAKAVIGSTANPLLNKLMRYYAPGKHNGGNMVSIEGPPGYGKSFSVELLGADYDLFVVHGCSPDINEIDTLVGGTVPDHASGGLIVVDGKLVEAFRAAADGKSVLLFLDEHYRLPDRAKDWLLILLQPVNSGGKRVFRVTTRRPVSGVLEVLEADCDNLHIVAAANLESITPGGAYWDRWLHRRIDYDEAAMSGIVQHVLDGFGIPADHSLAEEYTKVIGESRTAVAEGRTLYPMSPRDIYRACLFAGDATEQGVAAELITAIADKCQAWDADTGDRVNDNGVIEQWVAKMQTIADIAVSSS